MKREKDNCNRIMKMIRKNGWNNKGKWKNKLRNYYKNNGKDKKIRRMIGLEEIDQYHL